jgi:SNF2 family DNA or RNA helicase
MPTPPVHAPPAELIPADEYAALDAAVRAAEAAHAARSQAPSSPAAFRADLRLCATLGRFVLHARPCLPPSARAALAALPQTAPAEFRLADHAAVCAALDGAVGALPRALCELGHRIAERVKAETAGVRREILPVRVGRALWDRLLPFQRAGVERAVMAGGRVLLADEMGMGKTVVALAVAEFFRISAALDDASDAALAKERAAAAAIAAAGSVFDGVSDSQDEEWVEDEGAADREEQEVFNTPVLILCPATLRDAWVAAVSQWLPNVAHSAVHCLSSAKDVRRLVKKRARGKRDLWDNTPDVRFVICSYDLIPRLMAELASGPGMEGPACSEAESSAVTGTPTANATEARGTELPTEILRWEPTPVPPELVFRTVIADECHSLKNMSTLRTKACLPLILAAQYRILVSGTPVTSRPAELFPQMHAMFGDSPMSEPFLPPALFVERFCGGQLGQARGATNLVELNAMLSWIMVRRVKSDVNLNLPPKIRGHCKLELTAERLRPFYSMFRDLDDVRATLSDDSNYHSAVPKRSAAVIAELKSKSRVLHTRLYAATASAKVPGVITRLHQLLRDDQAPGRKVIVFAFHRQMLDAAETLMQRERIHFIRMDGSTPTDVRSSLVNVFQTDRKVRAAILSIKVAGTGLTLTAADWILFSELDWTPANLTQAEDRAHRIGRVGTLHVEYAVADGTLDDRLWPAIRHKLGVVGETIDGRSKQCDSLDPVHVAATLATRGASVQMTCLAAAHGVSWGAREPAAENHGLTPVTRTTGNPRRWHTQGLDVCATPLQIPTQGIVVNSVTAGTPGKRIRLSPPVDV